MLCSDDGNEAKSLGRGRNTQRNGARGGGDSAPALPPSPAFAPLPSHSPSALFLPSSAACFGILLCPPSLAFHPSSSFPPFPYSTALSSRSFFLSALPRPPAAQRRERPPFFPTQPWRPARGSFRHGFGPWKFVQGTPSPQGSRHCAAAFTPHPSAARRLRLRRCLCPCVALATLRSGQASAPLLR